MSIPGDQQGLRETLSALMDGEAEGLELRRVLKHGDDDGELRAAWQRMQLVRAGLRHELPALPLADIAARVQAAIENEEQVVASPLRSLAARVAVAASVTLAVLVGSQWVLKDSETTAAVAQTQQVMPGASRPTLVDTSTGADPLRVAGSSRQSTATIMSVPLNVLPPEASRLRIDNYMLYHAQHAAQNDSRGIVPMANAAYFNQ